MFAEALRVIQETAQKAQVLTVVNVPGDPERILVAQNGSHEVLAVPYIPKPQKLTAATIGSFAEAYTRHGATFLVSSGPGETTPSDKTDLIVRPAGAEFSPRSIVWVDNQGARFYFNEADRRETCELPFVQTDIWTTVLKFAGKQQADHKALVRLLRHDLAGFVDPLILAAFRSLDFEAMQRALSIQNHGKQSLDAQVTAQVMGGDKPEGFTVVFPVFANRELRNYKCTVGITVDIDAAEKRVTLQAVPDALDTALDDALENAADRLRAELLEETIVLRGTPA